MYWYIKIDFFFLSVSNKQCIFLTVYFFTTFSMLCMINIVLFSSDQKNLQNEEVDTNGRTIGEEEEEDEEEDEEALAEKEKK